MAKQIAEKIPIYLPFVAEKPENGGNDMIIQGCAGTDALDLDEQRLTPKGFLTDYFLKSGFINWNHQMSVSPDSIIGEPITAETNKNNEFMLRGRLYDWNPLAISVWNVASNLEDDPQSDRMLGYSLEGLGMEEKNGFVSKVLLTSCAVAPIPKNNNTYLQIVKGITVDEIKDIRKANILTPVFTDVRKGISVDYILNLRMKDRQVLVDTDFNIEVRECEYTNYSMQDIQKAIIHLYNAKKNGLVNDKQVQELKKAIEAKGKLLIS